MATYSRILVITRPRLRAFHEYVVGNVFQNANIKYITENRGDKKTDFDLMGRFYTNYIDSEEHHFFSDEEVAEIIRRDRFLRSLENNRATAIVRAMAVTVSQALDELTPDLIFSIMTDNYIVDIFERIQGTRGKIYIGTVMSVIDNYFRLTRRGELIKYREVTEDEVDGVYRLLTNPEYKPAILNGKWIASKGREVLSAYFKEKIKSIIFPLLKIVKNDPLNFHLSCLNGIGATSDRFTKLCYKGFFDGDWRAKLGHASVRNTVLIPMQFTPESSIDYMCSNLDHVDHDAVIERMINIIPREKIILIKEHPAMVGKKDIDFYRKISRHPNVIMISPQESMRSVLEYCGHVITWSGSTGLEGRLLGRNVICLQKPYYFVEGQFHVIDSISELPELLELSAAISQKEGKK